MKAFILLIGLVCSTLSYGEDSSGSSHNNSNPSSPNGNSNFQNPQSSQNPMAAMMGSMGGGSQKPPDNAAAQKMRDQQTKFFQDTVEKGIDKENDSFKKEIDSESKNFQEQANKPLPDKTKEILDELKADKEAADAKKTASTAGKTTDEIEKAYLDGSKGAQELQQKSIIPAIQAQAHMYDKKPQGIAVSDQVKEQGSTVSNNEDAFGSVMNAQGTKKSGGTLHIMSDGVKGSGAKPYNWP